MAAHYTREDEALVLLTIGPIYQLNGQKESAAMPSG